MKKSLAIVGATGVVGTVVLKVLEEFNLDFETIIPVASSKSVGKYVTCFGRRLQVTDPDSAVAMKPDFAIFSAGKVVSKKYAPLFAEVGTIVIDNSSAWRMDKDIPLGARNQQLRYWKQSHNCKPELFNYPDGACLVKAS